MYAWCSVLFVAWRWNLFTSSWKQISRQNDDPMFDNKCAKWQIFHVAFIPSFQLLHDASTFYLLKLHYKQKLFKEISWNLKNYLTFMQISKDEMNFQFTGKGCHCTLKTPVIYIEIVPFIITFYLMSTFYLCILRLKNK